MARPKKASAGPKLTTSQWWRAAEHGRKPHEILSAVVLKITEDQSDRYDAYARYARAYGVDTGNTGEAVRTNEDRLSLNELTNTGETLIAQIFSNRVVPAPVCDDADWDEYERAVNFGRWLEGVFDESRVHDRVVPVVGQDTVIYGTGPIKTYHKVVRPLDENGNNGLAKIMAQRVSPRDVFVDRLEARAGNPRNMHQRSLMDRWVCFDQYGADDADLYGSMADRREQIQACNCGSEDHPQIGEDDSDQIVVWESWHLPSGPNSKDGRHCVWIKNCTLLDEPWERERFPFTFIRFGIPDTGFWGDSIVKRLLPAQKAYDKLTQRIDDCHDIMGVPRLLVRKGTGVTKSHIDDVPGSIIEYEGGQPPQEWNAQPITPDAYRERDSLPQRMRAVVGVSQFEANQELPPQLREASGVAIERWEQSGNARHAMLHRSYEAGMTDLADLFIDEAEYAQKMGYEVAVKAPSGSRTMSRLMFSDVHMDRESYVLKILPVSQLSRTFTARLKQLAELKAEGAITQEQYVRLAEVPDNDGTNDLISSDQDIIMKNLNWMVKHGKYIQPLPFDNLDMIIAITTRYINRFRVRSDTIDEETVSLLATYIEDAIKLKGGLGPVSAEAAPPGPPGMPMGPPGMGPPPDMAGGPMPPQGPPGMAGQIPPEAMGPPLNGAPPGPIGIA